MAKALKIAFVGAGPIETFATSYRCLALAQCLAQDHGVEPHFVVAANEDDQRTYGPEHKGVCLHYVPDLPILLTGWRFDPQLLARTLVRVLRRLLIVIQLRPALVHVFKPLPETLLTGFILKCLGYRVVLDEDDADADMMVANGHAQDAWCYWLTVALSRVGHRICHHVTVASRAFETRYQRRGATTSYIPNGIFAADFSVEPTRRSARRREVEALYLGALERCFDADLMIEAFGLAHREFPYLRLLVVGDGPMGDELQARARALSCADAVEFVGRVPKTEVIDWLDRAQIFLFPMRNNWINVCRCPLKLREFAATGKPIIAPALGEVLEAAPSRDTLVKPDAEPRGYADRLVTVAQALQEGRPIGTNARSPEDLDWHPLTRRLISAYATIWPQAARLLQRSRIRENSGY